MRAVLHTGGGQPWAESFGDYPWALLPVGSRPLMSYWLELCVDLGIRDVQVVLGREAEFVELFCGNGEKWGLRINYSFMHPHEDPVSYLSRDIDRWTEGLLYIGDAFFPRRTETYRAEQLQILLDGWCVRHRDRPALFISRDEDEIRRFIRDSSTGGAGVLQTGTGDRLVDTSGLDPVFISTVPHYYQLNMEVVAGEMNRYLSSGYSSVDGAAIGTNVITPSSAILKPPLAIGNDCRIGAISSIGPDTVISDHVLIDRQSEISRSIILSDTYIGRNLEVNGKIVSGNRIIDPQDGTVLEIEDPWLVAQTRPRNFLRDVLRAVFGWQTALLLTFLQIAPFLIFYGLIGLLRQGMFEQRDLLGIGGKRFAGSRFVSTRPRLGLLTTLFCGFSLDRFPQLLDVLCGRLWLCGQVPKEIPKESVKDPARYFPAVFSYCDAFVDIDRQMDALYYIHTRSVAADLRILRHALFARFVEMGHISARACRRVDDGESRPG
jgi:hypothetical protein